MELWHFPCDFCHGIFDKVIPIDRTLVRRIVEEKFESIDGLLEHWLWLIETKARSIGPPRDRSVLYKWLKQGVPSTKEAIFSLAGVLDVDPISIVDLQEILAKSRFQKERVHLHSARKSHLYPLRDLFVPDSARSDRWPNDHLAIKYFGRPWFVKYFDHDPERIRNVYASVRVSSRDDSRISLPETYHFAYRKKGVLDLSWRPYGVVSGSPLGLSLVSESGEWQTSPAKAWNEPLVVETYFGPGAASFCIASLHSFEIELMVPAQTPGALRFSG